MEKSEKAEKKGEEEMINKKRWDELKKKEKLLKQACAVLRTEEIHLLKTVERFLKEIRR
jgi:hypothetical protein